MGMFPASIMFSCGFRYDELTKLINKKKATGWLRALSEDKTLIDAGKWFALKRGVHGVTYFYIILTEPFDFKDYSYCCKLAHEVLHICQFFLPDVLNRDREFESEAYLHTYIMESCLKAIRGV